MSHQPGSRGGGADPDHSGEPVAVSGIRPAGLAVLGHDPWHPDLWVPQPHIPHPDPFVVAVPAEPLVVGHPPRLQLEGDPRPVEEVDLDVAAAATVGGERLNPRVGNSGLGAGPGGEVLLALGVPHRLRVMHPARRALPGWVREVRAASPPDPTFRDGQEPDEPTSRLTP